MSIAGWFVRKEVGRGVSSRRTLCALLTFVLAVVGTASAENGHDIEEIIITGAQSEGAAAVGRNALDQHEQARSIQIFDYELIEQLKPGGLEDVIALSANVAFDGSTDGREARFIVRGFGLTPVLRDGFRVTSFGSVSDPEIYNLESIEVLKGPDSILYGESNPGGLINLRTKRPLMEDHTRVVLEAATDSLVSPRIDVNRRFGDVAARLVGVYRYDESFQDFDQANKSVSLLPTMRWDNGNGTILTLLGEMVLEDVYADFGTALGDDGELTAPISQVSNHPQDSLTRDYYSAGFDFEHRIGDGLTAEARVRYIDSEYNYSVLLLPVAYDDASKTYFRVPADQQNRNKEWAGQMNLFGDYSFGGMDDRFTIGIDYRDSDNKGSTLFDPGALFVLDWTNPDYSAAPPARDNLPTFPGFGDEAERVGVFVQNHLQVTDALLFSAGVRHDQVDSKPADGSASGAYDIDNTSVQTGLRYVFSEPFSVYVNYSESFTPNSDRDRDDNILPPETGDGWEVGAKGRIFDGTLSYTAAYFSITKENVPLPDPLDPFASIASGKQRAKGAEMDISGFISERWSLIFSVGFTDTKDETGFKFRGSPELTSSLYTTWEANDRWSVSAGYEYVGERVAIRDANSDGDDSDNIEVDPHVLLNGAIRYKAGRFGASLNVANLTDERYLDAVAYESNARGNFVGAPRRAIVSLSYEFD